MKKTFLLEEHKRLGAKIVPFAGWEMPVQYTSIIEEHKNVRENIGLFDVSHMGEVFIKGPDALKFLNYIVPANVSKLVNGKALYTHLVNEKGGIIDDLIIYKLEENSYFLIVNASRIDEDVNWISYNSANFDIEIDNQSHNLSMIAIQGPKAHLLIEKMGVNKEIQPKSFSIIKTKMLDKEIYLSRTGYTGEDGFEVVMKNKDAKLFWNETLAQGKEFGILPVGLGARDTLRLEAALPLYGNDLDEATTPVEAGLAWTIDKEKPDNYIAKDVIMGQIKGEVEKTKKFIGFEMVDKAIARHEYEIYYENEKVGIVTSGGPSPSTGKNIGLGYVDIKDNSIFLNKTIGMDIDVMIRNKLYKAQIVARPFVQKKNSVK